MRDSILIFEIYSSSSFVLEKATKIPPTINTTETISSVILLALHVKDGFLEKNPVYPIKGNTLISQSK